MAERARKDADQGRHDNEPAQDDGGYGQRVVLLDLFVKLPLRVQFIRDIGYDNRG
jgi:hypothetical protein